MGTNESNPPPPALHSSVSIRLSLSVFVLKDWNVPNITPLTYIRSGYSVAA
jgi:hypothetical protein